MAVLSLVQNGIVPLKGLDVQLAQPIESNVANAINFGVAIVQHGLLCEQPLFNLHDFIVTIALFDDASSTSDTLSR